MIAAMVDDGTLCATCGTFVDSAAPGHRRYCSAACIADPAPRDWRAAAVQRNTDLTPAVILGMARRHGAFWASIDPHWAVIRGRCRNLVRAGRLLPPTPHGRWELRWLPNPATSPEPVPPPPLYSPRQKRRQERLDPWRCRR